MKLRISAPTCCTAIPPVTDFIFHLFSKKTPSSLPGHGVFFCCSAYQQLVQWTNCDFYILFLFSYFAVRMRIVRISYGLIVSSISFSFTPSAPSIGFSRRSVSSADAIASAQCRVTFVLAFSTSYRRTITPSPSSAFFTVSSTTSRLSTDRNYMRSFSAAPATAFAGTFRFRASCSVPASRHVPACGYRE